MIGDPTPFVGKFTQEARELIQKLNDHLMVLEQSPDNQDTLRELMRTAHTLKGSAKILRFQTISRLAHKIEDVLSGLYEGRISNSSQLLELLFVSTDLLIRCVDAVSRHASDTIDSTSIEALLERAGRGEPVAFDPQQPPDPNTISIHQAFLDESNHVTISELPSPATESADTPLHHPASPPIQSHNVVRIDVQSLDNVIRLVSEMAVSHRKSEHELQVLKDLLRLTRKHATLLQQLKPRADESISASQKSTLTQTGQTCAALVERLLNERRDETAYNDLLLNELYDAILTMRMLPLSTVFQTFPRAVRDLAHHVHKQVELQIQGENTALDKKIIDKLSTPLMHLLRNSIDHGIETPEERLTLGKSATGRITILAQPHRGHIEIVITDDGRGIPVEKLRQRLVARGVFSEEQIQHMPDADIINTIFLPGVSTSDMITDLSGRGFGMDIVKNEIEQLKGSVTLTSQPGQGTRCTLTLPLTLTTVRCLTIAVRGQHFAVPIESLEETVYIAPGDCIQVASHQAIRLRNQMIYVMPLADILALPGMTKPRAEKLFILIAHSAGKRVGLIVDDILDEQDFVQKPLPIHLQHLKTVAGASIAGNNAVVLILHVPEIVKLAGQATPIQHTAKTYTNRGGTPKFRILLVEDSANTAEIERLILESHGYAVDVASNGLTALERLSQTTYDLIVTDVEMPGLDGFRLTEQVRRIPNYAQVPIVIVTSLERDADQRRGIEVGANAYITKGDFEQSRLVETIKSLLEEDLLTNMREESKSRALGIQHENFTC